MIPKIAHIVWNNKEVLNSDHPFILNGLRSFIKLNPDWRVTVYTPEEVDVYLKSTLPLIDYALVKDRPLVSKVDLWRSLKMYFEGGFYMDIDRMVNIPLSDIITSDDIKWVITTNKEFDFSFDVMISAPRNPTYKQAFEMYLARVREGWNHIFFLGPQTYMHAVSYVLCGEIVDINPGVEKFQMLRDKIAELSFAKTYREVPYDNMLLYRGNKGHELEIMKRDFYGKEGVKHWTGEW